MVRTPQCPQRLFGRLLALVALLALFGTACGATPSWIPVETAESSDAQPADSSLVDESVPTTGANQPAVADEPPAELAFVTDDEEATSTGPSDAFCTASANIWIHSAALNMIDTTSNPEMSRIALANVAEWLERSTLHTDEDVEARVLMFEAFDTLQAIVADDFEYDWQVFQASAVYANDPAAQIYDTERTALVHFIADGCTELSTADLRSEADARVVELTSEFGIAPSTVVESDSLPGHSIFTHSSGRLIASFPTAWAHDENRSDALVDLIASPDIDRFLDGDAIDGVRLQLLEAASEADFRALIDATLTSRSCLRTVDLSDSGTTRVNITQTFECSDHGASIIGQYNESRGLGLIIEASFDRVDPSRADLIRLGTISNSALWG